MKMMFISLSLLACLCCNSQKSKDINSRDRNTNPAELKIGNQEKQYFIVDTLTNEEKKFLNRVSNENEFVVLSNKVARFYSPEDSTISVSKLLFDKEWLRKKGYIFFELKFYGKISEPNIYYNYSLGQASFGFGTVVGSGTDDYLHSLNSCGVTACIIQTFKNGVKIFEKSE